jgi:hypothetical protein
MYTNIAMTPDFQQIIQESLEELALRVQERNETDKRIGQLTKALRGLAPMLPEEKRPHLFTAINAAKRRGLGLTEVILDILTDCGTALTVSEIRERMEDIGYDFGDYSQPNTTIQNTIRRLTDGGATSRVLPIFPKDKAKAMAYKINPIRPGEIAKAFAKENESRVAASQAPIPPQSRLMKQLDAERNKK